MSTSLQSLEKIIENSNHYYEGFLSSKKLKDKYISTIFLNSAKSVLKILIDYLENTNELDISKYSKIKTEEEKNSIVFIQKLMFNYGIYCELFHNHVTTFFMSDSQEKLLYGLETKTSKEFLNKSFQIKDITKVRISVKQEVNQTHDYKLDLEKMIIDGKDYLLKSIPKKNISEFEDENIFYLNISDAIFSSILANTETLPTTQNLQISKDLVNSYLSRAEISHLRGIMKSDLSQLNNALSDLEKISNIKFDSKILSAKRLKLIGKITNSYAAISKNESLNKEAINATKGAISIIKEVLSESINDGFDMNYYKELGDMHIQLSLMEKTNSINKNKIISDYYNRYANHIKNELTLFKSHIQNEKFNSLKEHTKFNDIMDMISFYNLRKKYLTESITNEISTLSNSIFNILKKSNISQNQINDYKQTIYTRYISQINLEKFSR